MLLHRANPDDEFLSNATALLDEVLIHSDHAREGSASNGDNYHIFGDLNAAEGFVRIEDILLQSRDFSRLVKTPVRQNITQSMHAANYTVLTAQSLMSL